MINLKQRLLRRMASHHIAGTSAPSAIDVCRALRDRGFPSTVGVWLRAGTSPSIAAQRLQDMVSLIAESGLRSHLSIKLGDIAFDSKALCELLRSASERSMRIHIDSMGPETTERGLKILSQCRTLHDNIGWTIPAAWHRSIQDAKVIAGMGIAVRLVRGQWRDPAMPPGELTDRFLRIIRMLAGEAQEVLVATHNAPLAHAALKVLVGSGSNVELEQMLGLPPIDAEIPGTLGIPVRVYVPVGAPYLPYNPSDITHRPAILGWMLRDLCAVRPGFLREEILS